MPVSLMTAATAPAATTLTGLRVRLLVCLLAIGFSGQAAWAVDPDTDADGFTDSVDNCPTVANADQLDVDTDGLGNACDPDADGDGLPNNNPNDNCTLVYNPDQLNTDGDGLGNACDNDDDNDGVADASDAFPLDAAETVDTDSDGTGNNADSDDDNDGVADATDNCQLKPNPGQEDGDADGVGNACDTDADNDGIDNTIDNCKLHSNPDQLDTDSDLVGNVCDSDDDNDGVADGLDALPLDATESVDTDNDGVGDNSDNCRTNANADQLNSDTDARGDACDPFPEDASLVMQYDGSAKQQLLGASLAMADMNADGVADLLVGVPQANVLVLGALGKKAGEIRIYSGADGSLLRTLSGQSANQRFGTAIAAVPDQNEDGVPDVLVGEPLADVSVVTATGMGTLKDAGRIALYSGKNGRLIRFVVAGSVRGDRLGAAVAVADVNGDEVADLVAGVPYADGVGKDAGKVIVFDGVSNTPLYSRNGTQPGEHFGAALAVAAGRLYVGSPEFDGIELKDSGRLQVFDSAEGSSAALLALSGLTKAERLGTAVAASGLLWAVGVPGADPGAIKDAGAVQLFDGLVSTPFLTKTGSQLAARYGSALNWQADLNGDAVADLAIGAIKFDLSMPAYGKTLVQKDTGRVQVWSGVDLQGVQ